MLKKYSKIVALLMLALGINILDAQAKEIITKRQRKVIKTSQEKRAAARMSLDKQQAFMNDETEKARREAAKRAEEAQIAVDIAQQAALDAMRAEEAASAEARRIAQVKEAEARDAAREAAEAAKRAQDQARQAADEAAQRLEAARAAAEKMKAHAEGVIMPFESPEVTERVVKARSKKARRNNAAVGG